MCAASRTASTRRGGRRPAPTNRPTRRGSKLVLAWGRVRYEKGFHVLARAVAALRPRVPGLECMIVGRGTYLPELQSQIDIAGVGNLIEVPGYLPDDDLRAVDPPLPAAS